MRLYSTSRQVNPGMSKGHLGCLMLTMILYPLFHHGRRSVHPHDTFPQLKLITLPVTPCIGLTSAATTQDATRKEFRSLAVTPTLFNNPEASIQTNRVRDASREPSGESGRSRRGGTEYKTKTSFGGDTQS